MPTTDSNLDDKVMVMESTVLAQSEFHPPSNARRAMTWENCRTTWATEATRPIPVAMLIIRMP